MEQEVSPIWTFVTIGIIIAIIVLIVVIVNAANKKARKSRSTCKTCGATYNYDEDVVWNVISERDNISGGAEALPKHIEDVSFQCRCPNCGQVKTFNKSYVTAKTVKTANGGYDRQYFDLETLIRKDFL